ncbi:Long-chain-fatty-acid--AMP ligase FadD29 [Legionella massiliensis]|uniref:Long-chain-fatty-acid--AMP ligase FadD29 n=1 Tax=Legionella massiliensis TaxID=1034943 RepID=A0A078KRR7_9GAMM|nr:fatty acyl-AMP ligase [Legionella massiliensis]CDZ77120.1 Long-chain-fatty-acid--AMP ligase FadD29 [Legionella massiliensis]CEE12858.1 Long-chain-fatty-acid--AMP ligase FadD29 [Legionella massiliensis]
MNNLSILESLDQLIRKKPDLALYRFIEQDGTVQEITPIMVDFQAKKIAAQLQAHDSYQKPVIILYEPGCEYIFALFGCLYAGAIPVPAYPPLNEEMASTLKKIIDNSQTKLFLTNQKIKTNLRKLKLFSPLISLLGTKLNPALINVSRQLNQLEIINTSRIDDKHHAAYVKPQITSDEIAYIQYTSGSTKSPKGVVIRHSNLLANLSQLKEVAHFTEKDIYVSWLPPYHDMGLISGIFLPLYGGFRAVLFSPISFLQKPARWLQAISTYQGTVSGGPDFAYKMLTNKVTAEEIEGIGLSSWRLAFCGAETIEPNTFTNFHNKFSDYSLTEDIFTPCYGLAEAVVYVCSLPSTAKSYYKEFNKQLLIEKHIAEIATDSSEAQKIVSVGFCPAGAQVIIADPETKEPLTDGQIGELWFYGPNAARSYWNNSEESEQQLNAQLKEKSPFNYVRTGDLGFKYKEELFITGRIKDLIIINGLNHYSQDIESSVKTGLGEIKLGNIAAFSVRTEISENLIILVEIKSKLNTNLSLLRQTIRELIIEKHFISPQNISFIAAKTLPKTTSGKLKRIQCREDYLNNKFNFLESE